MLAEYNVGWFEEALHPDDLEGFKTLRKASPVPISGGEVLTRRQSFIPFITQGAFDIIQPDVVKCGGISEWRRIANMAEDHGIQMIPHGWNTAVGLATDLQLSSAFHRTNFVEYCTGAPYVDDITTKPWVLDKEGMLEIPSGPGIGIELDPAKIEKYSGVTNLLS